MRMHSHPAGATPRQAADVADLPPLASGGCDMCSGMWGPASKGAKSYPPDTISSSRIWRLKRCPTFVISYKLMLLLKKLTKSAKKKKMMIIFGHVEHGP
jgi:hypothetical protein